MPASRSGEPGGARVASGHGAGRRPSLAGWSAPVEPRLTAGLVPVGGGGTPLRRLAGAARAALPLPAGGDWRREDGWVAGAVLLLAVGTCGALLAVWAGAGPRTAAAPLRLLPLVALLSLAALAGGGAHAMRGAGEWTVWRGLTIAAAVAGGIWAAPSGIHARFALPWFLAMGMLGLSVRAGEVAAALLARPLQALAGVPEGATAAPAALPPSAGPVGATAAEDRAMAVLWGFVGEFWILMALAAALFGGGRGFRAGAAAALVGSATLLVGGRLTLLRLAWARRGFAVAAAHVGSHWAVGLAVAAGLAALALGLPVPGPLLGPAVRAVGAAFAHAALPAHAHACCPYGTPRARTIPPAPSSLGLAALLLDIVDFVVAWFFSEIVAPLFAMPLVWPMLAALAVLLVLALVFPRQTRALLRRMGALLAACLAFLAWLRWPRRVRAVLQRLGLLGPPADERAPAVPGLRGLERLWAFLDPRAAVRAAYRRFLREMAAAGAGRAPHVSPRAYARALGGADLASPAAPDVEALTAAYELARYSDHAAERWWVAAARRGLGAARRTLRGRRPLRGDRGASAPP